MLRTTLLFCMAFCLLPISSYATGGSLGAHKIRLLTEAELLKAEVTNINSKDEDVAAADNFFFMAQNAKNDADAIANADLAVAHYKTALARHSLTQSQAVLASSSEALKISEEKVQKYQKILSEISGSGKSESEGGSENE